MRNVVKYSKKTEIFFEDPTKIYQQKNKNNWFLLHIYSIFTELLLLSKKMQREVNSKSYIALKKAKENSKNLHQQVGHRNIKQTELSKGTSGEMRYRKAAIVVSDDEEEAAENPPEEQTLLVANEAPINSNDQEEYVEPIVESNFRWTIRNAIPTDFGECDFVLAFDLKAVEGKID